MTPRLDTVTHFPYAPAYHCHCIVQISTWFRMVGEGEVVAFVERGGAHFNKLQLTYEEASPMK